MAFGNGVKQLTPQKRFTDMTDEEKKDFQRKLRAQAHNYKRGDTREHIEETLKYMGHDPIAAMVAIAQEAYDEGDKQLSLAANKEIASYLYPKLKSVELKKTDDKAEPITIIVPQDLADADKNNKGG